MLLALALSASSAALAGDSVHQQSWWTPSPPEITVCELAQLMKTQGAAVPVDASPDKTRKAEGVIPGAVLLSSSSQFALSELPPCTSSPLIFYCASDRCGASHAAALRAMGAGYTNVAVLSAGIKGWKAAGNPVSKWAVVSSRERSG